MLASIICHEMAHIGGADEAEAQRKEEQLWTQFSLDGKVDQITALRYLAQLNARHAGEPSDRIQLELSRATNARR